VSVQARKLALHVRDQFNAQDGFRTAIDALRYCNVEEHRCVEITCVDTY
jgi:hypothetical protein